MANFKRKRRKNARSGCLFCKPHKSNGMKGTFECQTIQEKKAILAERPERVKSSAKYKSRRRFSIEERRIGRDGKPSRGLLGTWGVKCKWYRTEADRDEALRALRKSVRNYEIRYYHPGDDGIYRGPDWEYRAGPTRD